MRGKHQHQACNSLPVPIVSYRKITRLDRGSARLASRAKRFLITLRSYSVTSSKQNLDAFIDLRYIPTAGVHRIVQPLHQMPRATTNSVTHPDVWTSFSYLAAVGSTLSVWGQSSRFPPRGQWGEEDAYSLFFARHALFHGSRTGRVVRIRAGSIRPICCGISPLELGGGPAERLIP